MVAGGVVALLFALALWGLVKERGWATNLVIGLALFDIIGEFVAQGTLGIMITVSFIVATVLLVLGVLHKRQAAKAAPVLLSPTDRHAERALMYYAFLNLFPQPLHIAHRWNAEETFVLPIELRGVVVPNAIGNTGRIKVFAQHETPSLLQP